MSKRTRHGRKQDEAAWRSTEVDLIHRLRDAGVRVPEPINFVDGVLVMELVKDANGDPAPRLGDLAFGASEAREIYRGLIREVVRMLCAGVIHGDLSDFNVLMSADGPVLIDFPQSVDPARNQNARRLLLRDVENLHRFVDRFSPGRRRTAYAEEMWSLYESNRLEPDTELRGDYRPPKGKANTDEVLALIDDANLSELARRSARGEAASDAPKPLRKVVDFSHERESRSGAEGRRGGRGAARPEHSRDRPAAQRTRAKSSEAEGAATAKKGRKRRRRKTGSAARAEQTGRTSRGESPKSDSERAGASESSRRRRGARETRTRQEETLTQAESRRRRPAQPKKGARDGSASATRARPSRPRRKPRHSSPEDRK
jgi:RIO kinase 1